LPEPAPSAAPVTARAEDFLGPEARGEREPFDALGLPARPGSGLAGPGWLVLRGTAAAAACLWMLAQIPGDPAAPMVVAALITWFAVTGRCDLAPPQHR
jgi:hypothetical protein